MRDTVVVSSHLDDAVLSCYGVLSPEVTVVTALAGAPPAGYLGSWDAEGGARDSAERVADRRLEDRRALALSGAEPLHLDFPDRQYVGAGAMQRVSRATLSAALRQYLAEASTVYAPSALSSNSRHPLRAWRRRRRSDHALVRDAVLAVRPDALIYADLPYALSPDRGFVLPPELRRRGLVERSHRLEAERVAEKLKAVRCYATQLDQLTAIFGDFVGESALGREVVWAPRAR